MKLALYLVVSSLAHLGQWTYCRLQKEVFPRSAWDITHGKKIAQSLSYASFSVKKLVGNVLIKAIVRIAYRSPVFHVVLKVMEI